MLRHFDTQLRFQVLTEPEEKDSVAIASNEAFSIGALVRVNMCLVVPTFHESGCRSTGLSICSRRMSP